jgi:hypothetical protein
MINRRVERDGINPQQTTATGAVMAITYVFIYHHTFDRLGRPIFIYIDHPKAPPPVGIRSIDLLVPREDIRVRHVIRRVSFISLCPNPPPDDKT